MDGMPGRALILQVRVIRPGSAISTPPVLPLPIDAVIPRHPDQPRFKISDLSRLRGQRVPRLQHDCA
jgi:hypothetical protein